LRRYIFDEAPHLETLSLSVSLESLALGPINIAEPDLRLVKPLPNLRKLKVDSAALGLGHLISDVVQWAQDLQELDLPGRWGLPILSALGASGHVDKLKRLKLSSLNLQTTEALLELGRIGLRLVSLQMAVTHVNSRRGAVPEIGDISPP